MSLLRTLLKSNLKTRVTLRADLAQSRPAYELDKVRQWSSALNAKATSSDSKNTCSQLTSLIQYYTKPSTAVIPKIDWNEWKETIVSEDIVDNLKEKYEKVISEEYDVEKVVDQVIVSHSSDIEALNNELTFHGMVWLHKYFEYQEFLVQLERFGNMNEYTIMEIYDNFNGAEADLEELTETNNYLPGSKNDINIKGFLNCQFNWGKKVVSFYRHPDDDFKCARGTKNILGR